MVRRRRHDLLTFYNIFVHSNSNTKYNKVIKINLQSILFSGFFCLLFLGPNKKRASKREKKSISKMGQSVQIVTVVQRVISTATKCDILSSIVHQFFKQLYFSRYSRNHYSHFSYEFIRQ